MMHIRRYMDKVLSTKDKTSMDKLGDMFVKVVRHLKHCDYDDYKRIESELYILAYGEHLNEEMAHDWVKHMDHIDNKGTVIKGGKWSIDDTTQVGKQYGVDFTMVSEYDWYAVLNMMYTDYCKTLGEEVAKYVSMAKDWFGDVDVAEGKTYRYYRWVVGDK